MKKIIIPFLMLLILITSVAAMSLPHPIYGEITTEGYAVKGADIEVKNLDTGNKAVVKTNDNGKYQVDLGNIDPRYNDGDRIEVSILFCKSLDVCNRQITLSGGNSEVSWDIENSVSIPETIKIINYECWDGSFTESENSCPTKVECYDGSFVHENEECPVEPFLDASIVAAITIVIIGLGLLWAWAKNNGVQSKWRWVPGMAGILKYQLKRYKELCQLGKKTEAKKKAKTLLKYSATITEKYLNKLL